MREGEVEVERNGDKSISFRKRASSSPSSSSSSLRRKGRSQRRGRSGISPCSLGSVRSVGRSVRFLPTLKVDYYIQTFSLKNKSEDKQARKRPERGRYEQQKRGITEEERKVGAEEEDASGSAGGPLAEDAAGEDGWRGEHTLVCPAVTLTDS